MKYLGAYMLAVLGGNASPAAADIKNILASVGAEVENDTLERVMKELKGKDIFEVIEQGKGKLSAVPSGGGAVGAAAAGGDAPAAEAPKEESEKEDSDEEDMDMGFDLFD